MGKSNAVTRDEFIQQLRDLYGYTKGSATMLVEDFWNVVLDNLEQGRPVFFYGLGCFDMVERAERTFKSLRDQDSVTVPAHYVPRFYPGNAMKRAVKTWEDNEKRGLS